jgi:hypothetical protein
MFRTEFNLGHNLTKQNSWLAMMCYWNNFTTVQLYFEVGQSNMLLLPYGFTIIRGLMIFDQEIFSGLGAAISQIELSFRTSLHLTHAQFILNITIGSLSLSIFSSVLYTLTKR